VNLVHYVYAFLCTHMNLWIDNNNVSFPLSSLLSGGKRTIRATWVTVETKSTQIKNRKKMRLRMKLKSSGGGVQPE
jgi:hypothetical protein